MQKFENAFLRGIPVIALRTSTHAFNIGDKNSAFNYSFNAGDPWKGGFGKHVLGETWVSHCRATTRSRPPAA